MTASALILVALFPARVWAEPVTPEQALQQAQSFMLKHKKSGLSIGKPINESLQLTMAGEVSGLYVFNVADDEGFVIISNDDSTVPVLGYSDCGNLELDNIPDNMRAWLQGYADQIAWMKENNTNTRRAAKANKPALRMIGEGYTPITPMLSTQWNQGSPYNNDCPVITNYGNCVTGCVATAMAQIMNYHKWPQDQTGTIPSYKAKNLGQTMPSLSPTTFDWANMLDNYNNGYTSTQAAAVSKLMKYCGYSVEMNYWTSSGANAAKVADALTAYFDYNANTTQCVSRSFYTYANWVAMIYHELEEGRPVLYSGQAIDGGHAFVCDGYDYDDYFHINWGWGGASDSYFKLSVLNPDDQGIGGSASSSAFNFGQDAIVGIQTSRQHGTVQGVASDVNLRINRVTLSHSTITLGESVDVIINVTNRSSDPYDGDIWFGTGSSLTLGKVFEIPAGTSKDCVVTYTPDATGTFTVKGAYPTGGGYYAFSSTQTVLTVEDDTPTDLTVSDIAWNSAAIGWEPAGIAEKWNMRYMPVTLTTEDFEDVSTLSDWIPYDGDGDGKTWTLADGWSYDGSQCMVSQSWDSSSGALTPQNWLITPEIDFGGIVSFYAWGVDGNYPNEVFSVLYSTDLSTFYYLSDDITATADPTLYTFDLSGLSGTGRIAIIHWNCTDQFALAIDNMSFINSQGDWTTVGTTTDNPSMLRGLEAETTYMVEAQAVINDGGLWSDPAFFTTTDYGLMLANDDSSADTKNADLIDDNNGNVVTVTLSGRTLYRDGEWNTLCLPFSMTAEQVAVQLAPAELMTLSGASFADNTLTLDFEVANSIDAGKPYIIKWAEGGDDIDDPSFVGVTISNDPTDDIEVDYVTFKGCYSPVQLTGGDNTSLYLSGSSTLYYPDEDLNIYAFRAYFTLDGITAGDLEGQVNTFVLNFNGESTGITRLSVEPELTEKDAAWFTLDGRKLQSKPAAKGIYIHNGKKFVIK